MKFGKYLQSQAQSLSDSNREDWGLNFLDYKGLKDCIKESFQASNDQPGASYSPRETSLSVLRHRSDRDACEERFFQLLESEVAKVGAFTSQRVEQLSHDVAQLQSRAEEPDPGEKEALLAEAKRIGEEFLALEKYVNLNYLGFHKAVKKHDKMLPHTPCQQFYMHVLRNQPWVQGDHSNLLVQLSTVYTQLRGPPRSSSEEDGLPGLPLSASHIGSLGSASHYTDYGTGYGPGSQHTRRYWVRTPDVSAVKHHILQHLPVSRVDQAQDEADTLFVNSVYLDNASLEMYHGLLDRRPGASTMRIRWSGTDLPDTISLERRSHGIDNESETQALDLPERFVVPFLTGTLAEKEFVRNLRRIQDLNGGRDEATVRRTVQLFGDLSRVVSAKQLGPMLRTQAMRSAYGDGPDGGSSGVRLILDTNVVMVKENPYSPVVSERWARDLGQHVPRTEVTRFPHAVLDIQLDDNSLHSPPPWLEDLYSSGYLTEIHAFSKMLHGIATLLPDALQAVPYWVDDESVRASMQASGPSPPGSDQGNIQPTWPGGDVGIRRASAPGLEGLRHPILGDAPTLQLMPDRSDIAGFDHLQQEQQQTGCLAWWFLNREREKKLDSLDLPLLGENARASGPPPKNVFALERTYLTWVHMALTVGAIAAAMIGVSGGAATAAEKGLTRGTDLVAMIMLLLAATLCAYALVLFLQRDKQLQHQVDEESFELDSRGTQIISGVIVASLSAIFIISLVDFFMCL